MKTCVKLFVITLGFLFPLILRAQNTGANEFLYGACVYPEIMSGDEWKEMLNYFKSADMNVVRVGESAWGMFHAGPGQFDYSWLDNFLSDLENQKMKAILGTSSYVPPIWLVSQHPNVLRMEDKSHVYPIIKKSPAISDSVYRHYSREFITNISTRYKNNKTVIGWQLDNEIDISLRFFCSNPATAKHWNKWLTSNFNSIEELNSRFQLQIFGLNVNSFADIPPVEGKYLGSIPIGIKMNYWKFRRDQIFELLEEQATIIREQNRNQWITTNWIGSFGALTNDPHANRVFDISSIDVYHPSEYKPGFWKNTAFQFDLNRSVKGNRFIVMESTIGIVGNTHMNQFVEWGGGAMINSDRFFMQNVFPAAYGASGLLYWSGNRIHGSHAPYYGGVVGWNGKPELEFPDVKTVGAFYKKWGKTLLNNPVQASVAVLTDYEQRKALEVVPHVEGSQKIVLETFDIFHRMGIGVDALNGQQVLNLQHLKKYDVLVLPAVSILNDAKVLNAIEEYAKAGGKVIVTPLCDYLTQDAIFLKHPGSNLSRLTGVSLVTTRIFGGNGFKDYPQPQVHWQELKLPNPTLKLDGLAEILNTGKGSKVLARFHDESGLVNGYPAIVENTVGKGKVLKLAFWPDEPTLYQIMKFSLGNKEIFVKQLAPEGVHVVPRSDRSAFILNTTFENQELELSGNFSDRIKNRSIREKVLLEPYQVVWIFPKD